MLKFHGIDTRASFILMTLLVLLIVLTPLGTEATHPIVFVSYRTILVGIALICALQVYRRDGLSTCPTFMGVAFLALLLMLPSFVLFQGSNDNGFNRWYEHLLFGGAFLALAAFNRKQPVQWMQTLLTAIAAVNVVYLVAALAGNSRPLLGPFVNPNYFASFLLAGFSIGIAFLLFGTDYRVRAMAGMVAIFLYYGITQTWSRAGTLCAIGIVCLATLRFSRLHRVSWTKLALPIVAVLLGGMLASPVLIRKFLDRGEIDPYNYMRSKVWTSTIVMIADNPVFGVGLGNYAHAAKPYTPAAEGAIARYRSRMGIAHSEYLQYAAEVGLPAALLLLAVAGYLFVRAVRNAFLCQNSLRPVHEAAILAAAGIGSHALIDNNWTVPVMAVGLVAFSVADSIPQRTWKFPSVLSQRAAVAAGIIIVGLVYLHSTLIPWAGLHFTYAAYEAHTAGKLEQAESFYRMGAAIQPNHPSFLDLTGRLYWDLFKKTGKKKYLEFADHFLNAASAAAPVSDEPRRHIELVLLERLTGNADADRKTHLNIIDIDRDILRIDPFDPFIRKNLAEALYHTGSHSNAKQELLKAIEVEPNFVPAYIRLAEWYELEGDTIQNHSYQEKANSIRATYEHVVPSERYEALLLGRSDPAVKQAEVLQ